MHFCNSDDDDDYVVDDDVEFVEEKEEEKERRRTMFIRLQSLKQSYLLVIHHECHTVAKTTSIDDMTDERHSMSHHSIITRFNLYSTHH